MNTYTATYRHRHQRRRMTVIAETLWQAWRAAANQFGLSGLISVRPAK